jgi:hypothetical protein
MDDDNHEHHYRDREMEVEPRLEEVLETHLRYHAVFQVTFLGAVPLSRERFFDVPLAHQPGRKDAL